MPFYFAYGPDMDPEQLGRLCREAVAPLCIAKRSGHAIVFTRQLENQGGGTADIRPRSGEAVWGAVFEISDRAMRNLDHAEGMSLARPEYRRVVRTVDIETRNQNPVLTKSGEQIVHGSRLKIECYEAIRKRHEPCAPGDYYLMRMVKAALRCELPLSYISRLSNAKTLSRSMTVDDVTIGRNDQTEIAITKIYVKVPPTYAVYRTPDRVAVQFADDKAKAAEQRKYTSSLNAVRTQINGLIDGWSKSKHFKEKARRYESRVAAALILCLEDDAETARESLNDIKADITAERTSWGRFEYLISASIVTLASAALLFFFGTILFADAPLGSPQSVLLAAGAGTIGAFFSIALAIQSRTVLTNLHRRDNIADAILRIMIGVIAAGVLILMIKSKVLLGDFKIGSKNLDSWEGILVVGFVAGFLERLVPDLLKRSAANEQSGTGRSPHQPAAKPRDDAAASEGAQPTPADRRRKARPRGRRRSARVSA